MLACRISKSLALRELELRQMRKFLYLKKVPGVKFPPWGFLVGRIIIRMILDRNDTLSQFSVT